MTQQILNFVTLSETKINTMKNCIIALIICLPFISTAEETWDTMALKTPEGVAALMLEFISCEIGEEKDWEEYRKLFLPNAQKISINRKAPPNRQIRVLTLEEFVRRGREIYPRDGFEETVIGLKVNEFNGIANVFQSFYCKNLKGTYEARGVNSFQLVKAEGRWWIASTSFTNETEDLPLPDELLFEEYRK